ncbi:MAG: deoxyribodipyrimidine photo-lyase [Alphaproteobacteria bacterium]
MTAEKISIVWFKRDLRVADHAPLHAAVASGYPVLPLYIIEPEYWAQDTSSTRHWQFIRDCLLELNLSLLELGQPLIIRTGEAVDIFHSLFQNYQIMGIYAHQETGTGWTYSRDKAVLQACKIANIPLHEFPNNGVVRALHDRDKWGAIRGQRLGQPLIAPPLSLRPVQGVISLPYFQPGSGWGV